MEPKGDNKRISQRPRPRDLHLVGAALSKLIRIKSGNAEFGAAGDASASTGFTFGTKADDAKPATGFTFGGKIRESGKNAIIRVVVVSPLVLQNQKKSLRLLPLVFNLDLVAPNQVVPAQVILALQQRLVAFLLAEQLQRRENQLRVSHLVIMPAQVVKRKNLRIRRQHLAQVYSSLAMGQAM